MADSKHDAVWDWLQTCPHIKDLFFGLADTEEGGTKLIPSESVVETYIDGSSRRYYNCALTRFSPCSFEPNDTMNIENLIDFEQLGQWIEEQVEERELPVFPDGETIQDIAILPYESGFMVAQDLSSCKYMLQFQIEYIKERRMMNHG